MAHTKVWLRGTTGDVLNLKFTAAESDDPAALVAPLGMSRFTISVLEIIRNAEGKYLPRSFAMNFFDSATGDLQASLAYRNDWQRVGNLDLPTRILEICAHKGGSSTKEIVFDNCQLLKTE